MTLHSKNLSNLNAIQLIKEFPNLFPNVNRYVLVRYTPNPGVDSRVVSLEGKKIGNINVNEAGKFTDIIKAVPGLEALMAALNDPTEQAMKEMLRHDEKPERRHETILSAGDLCAGLDSELRNLKSTEALGIASNVQLKDGQTAHIPLLDFSLSPSKSHCNSTRTAAKLLGINVGAVLESGRSYHVYGFELLSQSEWIGLFARSLLLAPMVDVRFVAHRLLTGHSVLRINSTVQKPTEPHVVAAI